MQNYLNQVVILTEQVAVTVKTNQILKYTITSFCLFRKVSMQETQLFAKIRSGD